MACLRRLISPLKTSVSSSISPSISSQYLSKIPVSGKYGLRKMSQNLEPALPVYAHMQRKLVQKSNLVLGRKICTGSFLGLTAVTGMMFSQSTVAYAMDEHYAESGEPSGFLKDDIHTFWSLARKFQLPAVLLMTVLLGWRHPFTLAFNVLLLLFCTKPSPLSIYMFIEQLRQRDVRQEPRWHKSKFLYAKNVTVEDYKLLCLAKVELRELRLDVVGILGGWWVFHTLRI